VIPVTLDNASQCELQRYENSYKALNLNTTALVGICMIESHV
jgi:hypothetical protein